MPLGDVREYRRWVDRETPSLASRRVARSFVAELGDEPWRHPSVPIEALSNQPEFEVREAALPVEGQRHPVNAWYGHTYATGIVDLIAITDR